MNLKNLFRRKMNMNTEIIEKNLGKAMSHEMSGYISEWLSMYSGQASWLKKDVKSLGLPASISDEVSRLVALNFSSEVKGSERANFINKPYQDLISLIKPTVELACAGGGVIFKPYVQDGTIGIDVIQADSFIPTAFDSSGNITGAIFRDCYKDGNDYYTRLEYHHFEEGLYKVRNTAFVSTTKGDLGTEIPLSSVPKWKNLQAETTIENLKKPLFSYFKMPMANTFDTHSPLGVSVFSRATSLIREADKQYSRLLWEFKSGERAVYVDDTAVFRDGNGTRILPDKRLYRMISSDEALFKDWTPTLREQNLIRGLDLILRQIEFSCGLTYGTLSNVENKDKTAEEIRTSKQRSYAHVAEIQANLKNALTELCGVIDAYISLYNLAPRGDYYLSFDFDDSIIADRQTEFKEKLSLLEQGIMKPYEMRMWYFGEEEEIAKQNA